MKCPENVLEDILRTLEEQSECSSESASRALSES